MQQLLTLHAQRGKDIEAMQEQLEEAKQEKDEIKNQGRIALRKAEEQVKLERRKSNIRSPSEPKRVLGPSPLALVPEVKTEVMLERAGSLSMSDALKTVIALDSV